MQEKAVRFLRDVVGDSDRAEEFDSMSPQEYADHKRITIENPGPSALTQNRRRARMRRPTYDELKDRVAELEEENESLTEKLDSISDIASTDEEDDEEEFEEEGDDDLD
jgi:hypothetical protein